VNFANETNGEGKSVPHALQSVIQRCHIVGNFLHVVQRDARCFCVLIEQEVGKRRLRPLDLGSAPFR